MKHDREDLLREATAFQRRIQIVLDAGAESVFIGFRNDGSASLYFGSDPVYQFNAAGQLRRVYLNGRMIKAENGQLETLERTNRAGQVQLRREKLNEVERRRYLEELADRLDVLRDALDQNRYMVHGQVPDDLDVAAEARHWLVSLERPVVIAGRPHAAG